MLLSFGVAFNAGYILAMPKSLLHFFDANALANLSTLPVLLLGIAWLVGVVVHRWAANELFREVTIFEQIASRPSIGFFVLFLGFLFIQQHAFGQHFFQNWKWPIGLLVFFYFHFFVYGPIAPKRTIQSQSRALLRVLRKRPKRFLFILQSDVAKFVRYNSVVLVFLLGSWIGYARAQHLSIDRFFLVKTIQDDYLVHGPLLNTSHGYVFLSADSDGVLYFSDYTLIEASNEEYDAVKK